MSEESKEQRPGPIHDAFIIQNLGKIENARALFQQYAPPMFAEKAQWETLQLRPGHFVDAQLRSHFSDLLYTVELEEETTFLYLLFEHKSWVDVWTRLQLLVAMVQAWQEWRRNRPPGGERPTRLPFILPFVLYHGERGWTVSKEFAEFVSVPSGLRSELEKHAPRFEHVLVDLHAIPMEEIRGTAMVRLILGLLKAVSEGREEEWLKRIFEPSMEALRQPNAGEFVRSLFEYLTRASENVTPSTFRGWADRVSNDSTRKDIMTLAERFTEEGRQEGWQKGQQKGRRGAVLDLLELRLGPVPVEAREKIERLESQAELLEALRLGSIAGSYAEFLTSLQSVFP